MEKMGNILSEKTDLPLVSVIVPVYNVKGYLEECIDSITGQSYKKLEIIIIDDGSDDGSGDICDSFTDERIRVFHQENKGQSCARNLGLKHAKGEIISFIDADDKIGTYMIEGLLDNLLTYDVPVSSCGYTRDPKRFTDRIRSRGRLYDKKEALAHFLDHYGFRMSVSNKLYRRELFENVRFPEGEYFEDTKVTYLLLKEADALYHVDDPMYLYNIREDSTTELPFSKRNYDKMRVINFIMRDCRAYDREVFHRLYPGYAAYVLSFINSAIRDGKRVTKQEEKLKRFLSGKTGIIFRAGGICRSVRLGLLLFRFSPKLYRRFYSFYSMNFRKSGIVR